MQAARQLSLRPEHSVLHERDVLLALLVLLYMFETTSLLTQAAMFLWESNGHPLQREACGILWASA